MKRSILEVKENIQKVHGDKIILFNESLPKYKDKLTLKCSGCNNVFYATYDNLVNKGSGCPYCVNHIKDNTTFIGELQSIFGDKLIYNDVQYVNAKTPVKLICPKHGEFYKTPNKALCGQGCPKCKLSKLENITISALKRQGIMFETQKRFDWLGLQSLDFYLPKYNVAIECQGEQHFHQVYFNGKKDEIEERNLFENICKRDALKQELCIEKGVKILYFIDGKIMVEEIEKQTIYKENFYYNINELINSL